MKNANLIRMNKKRNNNFINNNNNNYGNNNNNNFVGIITIITKAEVVLHQADHIYFLMKLILIQKKINSPSSSDKSTNNDSWKRKSINDNYGSSNINNSCGNNNTSFTLEIFNDNINEGKINN